MHTLKRRHSTVEHDGGSAGVDDVPFERSTGVASAISTGGNGTREDDEGGDEQGSHDGSPTTRFSTF